MLDAIVIEPTCSSCFFVITADAFEVLLKMRTLTRVGSPSGVSVPFEGGIGACGPKATARERCLKFIFNEFVVKALNNKVTEEGIIQERNSKAKETYGCVDMATGNGLSAFCSMSVRSCRGIICR